MAVLMAETTDNPRAKKLYNLRDLRIDAGYFTQEDLAKAAKINQSAVSQAENGVEITRVIAVKILKVLRDYHPKLREREIDENMKEIDWKVKPTSKPPEKK